MEQINDVNRLQRIILLVRKSMGWSAEEFANKIGTTRQTINNLESNPPRSEMTKTQYIAIRSVLDREIEANPEDTEILKNLLYYCVDNYDEVTEDERDTIINKAKVLLPAVMSKDLTLKEAGIEWKELLKMTGVFAAGVFVGASINNKDWYSTITKPIEKTVKQISKNLKK